MTAPDVLLLTMTVTLDEDRSRAVFFLNAADLVSDDLASLIPGDAFILALAAILRVALTIRIPINTLHRILYTVLRVDALLVAIAQRRKERLLTRAVFLSAGFQCPRVRLLFGVLVIVLKWSDSDDLPILHID